MEEALKDIENLKAPPEELDSPDREIRWLEWERDEKLAESQRLGVGEHERAKLKAEADQAGEAAALWRDLHRLYLPIRCKRLKVPRSRGHGLDSWRLRESGKSWSGPWRGSPTRKGPRELVTGHGSAPARCPALAAQREGVEHCSQCGERIRDQQEEARDKAIAAVLRTLASVDRQQRQILERLDRLEREDRGRPTEDKQHIEEKAPTGSELVGPAKLAREFGRSPEWVRDHYQDLGGRRPGRGPRRRYWFDPVLARERFFGSPANTNGSKPDNPKKPPRRRRRSTNGGAELLPIRDRAA